MTPELFERFVVALESIADTIRQRYDRDYPPDQPAPEAEIFVRGERASEPETKEAYDSLEERPGRFQNLIEAARRTSSS